MSKLSKVTLYGATIEHDFLGLEATATYGDKTKSFKGKLDKQTGLAVEPSAFQQAQSWAKEQYKAAAESDESKRQQRIRDRVEAAKQGKRPEPKKPPAASEETE